MSHPILPGQTLGILGSGQLGRMLAMVAKRLGYQVVVFSPEAASPTAQVCDSEIVASYDETEALARFAALVDVVTLEFENIPVSALETLSAMVPVRPGPSVLQVAQHRLREKTYLQDNGFPVTPFVAVRSLDDLERAVASLGRPAVLKTAGFGYDGKGQHKITADSPLDAVWASFDVPQGVGEAILEAYVPFIKELSVLVARNPQGDVACFGPIENQHRHHVLHTSVVPAQVPTVVAQTACTMAQDLATTLDMVGVLCVEFFLTADETLLINEIAPRPHNSGHLTIEAAVTSQFEQQLRAVCGLPLGSFSLRTPAAAMVNILGDAWTPSPPDWPQVLAQPGCTLHLYGKAQPKPGRKMGHITALGNTSEQVLAVLAKTLATMPAK